MTRSKRKLNERLEVNMCKGSDEFIGFQVEGEWELVAIPHHDLVNQVAQKIPDYISLMPEPHDPRTTLSWAMKKVHVTHKVDFKKVPSKSQGFVTVQPHHLNAKKTGNGGKTSDHVLEADNLPQIALRLFDETIVAEDPNHPVAVAMHDTFTFLHDKLWHRDLVAFVSAILYRLGAVKKLKAASIWYVPWTDEAAKVLPALAEIIRSFEIHSEVNMCDLYVTKMPRSEKDDVRSATKSAQRTFSNEYKTIFSEIEKFIDGMFAGDVTRDATLQERIKASRFLKDRAELYDEILDLRSDNLKKALSVVDEATECLMDGAGDYRAAMKDIKKIKDGAEKEKEEKAAKADLAEYANEAQVILEKCRGILDPGTQEIDEAA